MTQLPLPNETLPTDRLAVTTKIGRATSQTKNHPLADPTLYVEVTTWASFDGGLTWVEAGGFGFFGGVHIRRDGTEADFSSLNEQLFPRGGADRLFKYEITYSKRVDSPPVVEVIPEIKKDNFIRNIDPDYQLLEPLYGTQGKPIPIDDTGLISLQPVALELS